MQEGIEDPSSLFEFLKEDFKSKLPIYHEILDLTQAVNEKVPLISHMIYLFKENSKKSLSDNNIEKIIRSTQELSKTNPNWQHYFWTNNKDNIDDRIKALPSLKIADINELLDHKLHFDLVKLINSANNASNPVAFLTQGSDLLRLMVLQKYGGVYHDCDYEIFKGEYIYNLAQNFSLFLTQESPEERDAANFFIASVPNHQVINNAVEMIYRNFNAIPPAFVTHAVDKINKLVFETGPCVLTAAFLFHAEQVASGLIDNDFMYFLAGGLSNYKLARSTKPYPNNLSCQNNEHTVIEEEISYKGNKIVTSGADLLCGSWGETVEFARPIEYFNTTFKSQELQCASANQLPNYLSPSDYSIIISGDNTDKIYECGY
jgi:hypothetical protein